MTAVLPNPRKDEPPFGPYDRYHWIFTRGLVLRAIVALFLEWTVLAFPGQSLRHAWLPGVVLGIADGMAWLAQRQARQAIVLWAMITAAFDLILGIVALTEFAATVESNAPALLPLIGIELIAYWNWIGYWIALGYSAVAIITLWPFPTHHLGGNTINYIVFWLIVNFLTMSGTTILLHRFQPVDDIPSSLTVREREVYQLLKSGLSQKDIAAELHIERSTVKTHVQHIHRKMGLDEPPDD